MTTDTTDHKRVAEIAEGLTGRAREFLDLACEEPLPYGLLSQPCLVLRDLGLMHERCEVHGWRPTPLGRAVVAYLQEHFPKNS
jgi:hypothetical protein